MSQCAPPLSRQLGEPVRTSFIFIECINISQLNCPAERESVRAGLRRNVRLLLAKYGYPPDLAEDATQLVLRQAELSTENSE